MSRWFRFYDEAIDDPKILKLSDEAFRAWVGLLCVASKNKGVLPSTTDLGFHLRVKPSRIAALITQLVSAGLLDKNGDSYAPHNWTARQYKSEDRGKDSYVYVIGAAWDGALKIGFSKNPWARLGDLQSAHHEKLSVLAVFRCKSHSEVELHGVLHDYRKNGEWFSLPSNVYDAIRVAADDKATYESLVATLRDLLRSATTEQKQTTEAEQSRARAEISNSEKVLRTDLMEAFGPSRTPELSRAGVWLSKGYAAGMIVEVVRELLARKPDIGNLAYFDSALAERHANQPLSPSERAAIEIDYDKTAALFKKGGPWSKHAGPEPGQTGCKCPPEILAKYGLEAPPLRRMDS